MMADVRTGSLGTMDLDRLEDQVPELRSLDVHITTDSLPEPKDSSDMLPADWSALAERIAQRYDETDGFVILHGSDTMAYTASALSFMLEGLNKPVIFTGSQLPVGVKRTDARENLVTAIEIAAALDQKGHARVPEVAIYFEYGLYRGNRTTKVSAERFEAFRSPNYLQLGEAGVHIKYNESAILPFKEGDLKPHFELDTAIGLVKLFPGISSEFLAGLIDNQDIKVIVLETFGSGNASTETEFLTVLRSAIEQGRTIIDVTQCIGGAVHLGRYRTSMELKEMGVLSGHDITTESAITKSMFLLGKGMEGEAFKEAFTTPLSGEMTLVD